MHIRKKPSSILNLDNLRVAHRVNSSHYQMSETAHSIVKIKTQIPFSKNPHHYFLQQQKSTKIKIFIINFPVAHLTCRKYMKNHLQLRQQTAKQARKKGT